MVHPSSVRVDVGFGIGTDGDEAPVGRPHVRLITGSAAPVVSTQWLVEAELVDIVDQALAGNRRAVDQRQADRFLARGGCELDRDLLIQVAQAEGRRLRFERSRVDPGHVEQCRHDFFHSI
jgi:hypothetical protein